MKRIKCYLIFFNNMIDKQFLETNRFKYDNKKKLWYRDWGVGNIGVKLASGIITLGQFYCKRVEIVFLKENENPLIHLYDRMGILYKIFNNVVRMSYKVNIGFSNTKMVDCYFINIATYFRKVDFGNEFTITRNILRNYKWQDYKKIK